MPADRRVIRRHVSELAMLALEDVLVIGRMRRRHGPDQPHGGSTTWALGIRRHPASPFYIATFVAPHGRRVRALLSQNRLA